MPAVLLPSATALVFAVGAGSAYTATPLSSYGDAYRHVPSHLVSAGLALLVAASVLVLSRRGSTARARRRGRQMSAAWGLLSAGFVLDAVGGALGDRSGDYAVHDLANVLLVGFALLVLVTSLLVAFTRGGWAPWPLRLAVLISAPAIPFLGQASSGAALAVGLATAAVWAVLAVQAAGTRKRAAAAPDPSAPAPVPSTT